MSVQRPRIIVVGAGFGGLETVRALRHAAADITVIDRQNHHCFQPLLYQVATAALSPAEIAWPIRHILRTQKNATVLMEDVLGVDAARKVLITNFGEMPFDYLVLATGATHSYFGHDQWAPFAPGLKRIDDGTRIRRHILVAFEKAEIATDSETQRRLLTFVIVGGGATGVEMAGAIAEIARQTLAMDFRRIDPRNARIVLVEAGPRLLPAFPPEQSDYVRDVLAKAGVKVMADGMVTKCDAGGVDLGPQRLPAATIIWAAGVTSSPAAKWLGAEADRAGRTRVNPDLSVPGHRDIFVIGDAAAVMDANGKPVPGIAPAAKQMGHYVGGLIAARIAGGEAGKPFRYKHLGDLATIGRRAAVVQLGRFRLRGYLCWWFWGIAHIYFLIGIRNRFIVAFSWLWSYLTFQRGARLITRAHDDSP